MWASAVGVVADISMKESVIANFIPFCQFAELESLLGDIDRARAIYELAVNQPRLDMPELLWKAYIDFEVGLGETEKARELYERLLERTLHVKVQKIQCYHYIVIN